MPDLILVSSLGNQVDPSGLYGHALCLDAVREEFAPEAVLQADFVGDGLVKALVMASYPVHHKGKPMDTPMDTFDGTDAPKNISMFVWSSAIPDFAGVPATTLRAAVRVMDIHPISIRSSSKGSEMDVTCVRACGGEEELQLAFNRRMRDAEASHPAASKYTSTPAPPLVEARPPLWRRVHLSS
ncbi:hypothetical protein CYMTET_40508 [Cymbomonas tetramitiformis]|uniref:Uncharacterized protein n=1 Tax=Cymbomonas tetramitiformis TaxID=36881 RepID=A0AAE0F3G5_9CHLO|nr:hypothetical protein CYMTET_40508 [Cymbomonas tetramitiformis]